LVRELDLRALGYASYNHYLRSRAWSKLKARLEDLIPLCAACHQQAHILERAGVIGLDLQGFYYDAERAAVNIAERLSGQAERDAQVGTEPARQKVHDAVEWQRRRNAKIPLLIERRKETREEWNARCDRAARKAAKRLEAQQQSPRAKRISL
jgi:hypothetical protein